MALENRPFSYVKGQFQDADYLHSNNFIPTTLPERPKTMASRSNEINEFQAMRGRLRPVTPSPKPSPRKIWHPQENFIGPLENYIPAEFKKDGDYRLSRTVSPSDFVVPKPVDLSPSKRNPVPRPRTRGRSPVRRVYPNPSTSFNDRPTLSSMNKEKPKIGSPERPVTRGKSSERPKSRKGTPERSRSRKGSPEGPRSRRGSVEYVKAVIGSLERPKALVGKLSPEKTRKRAVSPITVQPSRTCVDRSKIAKVAPPTQPLRLPESPEERITTRMGIEPIICRTCGMSPERNVRRPMTSGAFPDGITLRPRISSISPERPPDRPFNRLPERNSERLCEILPEKPPERTTERPPERPNRAPSPMKFVIPIGDPQDDFPSLTLEIKSRCGTPDKTFTIYSPRKDEIRISTSSHPSSPQRAHSTSPRKVKGKPPRQPGEYLNENSPRTQWVVDRPCRTPSPVPVKVSHSRSGSPLKSINAYMKPPSRGPSPAGRCRSPSIFDFSIERLHTAPVRRTNRQCCVKATAKSTAMANEIKKKAVKLVDAQPEYVYHHPTMPILKHGPDLPPPHTKLRPEPPQIRPRSLSKNSASFVVMRDQTIDLPERMQSPKREAKKGGAKDGKPDMVKAALEAEKAMEKSAANKAKANVAAAAAAQIESASAAANLLKRFGSKKGSPTKAAKGAADAAVTGSTTSLRSASGSTMNLKGSSTNLKGSVSNLKGMAGSISNLKKMSGSTMSIKKATMGSTTSITSEVAASPKQSVKSIKSMKMVATANSSTVSIRSQLSKSVAFDKSSMAGGDVTEAPSKESAPTKADATPSKASETPSKSVSGSRETLREKGSNQGAAKSFNKAITNVKGDVQQSQKKIFSTVNSAVNMQQEKVSITSADRAAILHDKHAAGEKDHVPDLLTDQKGRRHSKRFTALGKLARMGARMGFANKSSTSEKTMSRTSSKTSLNEKQGNLSKSSSQTSFGKMRSATGILGSIASMVSKGSDNDGSNSPAMSKKSGRMSANKAMRAMSAAKNIGKRADSKDSLNKSRVALDGSDAESGGGSKKGSRWNLRSKDEGNLTQDSRSSSMASVAPTPPSKRGGLFGKTGRAMKTFARLGSRRESMNSEMNTPNSSIPSTPKTPRTPHSLKKISARAGKVAVFGKKYKRQEVEEPAGAANPAAAPAEMEVLNEVESRNSSKVGSQATLGSKKGSKRGSMFSRGNESLGEELVARLESISGSEMDESMGGVAQSCCGFRGMWAHRLAARMKPGCCDVCIRTPPPPKEHKWAKSRSEETTSSGDPEMQPTEDTPQKMRLIDKLKGICGRKKPNSADPSVMPEKNEPPRRTLGQRLKRVFACAAMRACCAKLSCAKCCSKLSCRGCCSKLNCCSKISCACCCPCFAKCCCRKCRKGSAVGDATPNPLDSKRPSLQSKRRSRPSIANEPIVRKLDVSLLDANSLLQRGIPVLSVKLAWICLILNIFVPGLGTIFSGAFCLCMGRPRFSVEDRPEERIGTFVLDLIVGVSQLFTVLFCLVGWGWSIWWGTIMLRLARKNRRLMARAADEAAAKPAPVAPGQPAAPRKLSDPANKK